MKKAINIITTSLLVLVLLVAVALVGVKLVGLTPYTVLSGSMEPHYHVGSVIYVVKVDAADLVKGDAITYVIEGGTVVTHRIVEVLPNYGEDGSLGFITKGDANNTEDGTPVHERNILGKAVFSIPLLGYLAYFIQNPPGSFLAIGLCAVIVLLTFLPGLVDKLMEEEAPGANGEAVADAAEEKADDATPTPPPDDPKDPNGSG